MQVDPMMMWNIIITVILGPVAWAFSKMFSEIKRLQILLNRTREDYATKNELHNETKEIKELILRLEVKLDRFIEKNNG
jgi:membrane protein insertase Oxa1/YidC/SpoIIIJ|tara:strand:- start:166 stop:402 length:237 start_codon:yes stop_codon:yes gene_type:complete